MKPKFIVRNEAGKRAVLRVSGVIDDYFDGQTFNMTDSERDLIRELEMIPDDRGIDLHVNSPGGKVSLALGMHNALKSVQDRLRVINTGNMLSSATLLAPPKAKLLMTRGSVAMVHKPLLEPDQPMNSNDMRNAIECLDANEKAMAEIYSDRTGKSMKAAREWMEGPTGAGTWMTGSEAIDHGFGDGDFDDDDDDFGPGGDPRGAMSSAAVIAKFNGNIPDKYKQLILAAGENRDPSPKKPVTSPAASFSSAKEAGKNGGKPATTENQPKGTMLKVVATLAAAGFKFPAEATEDQVNAAVSDLLTARASLTQENSELKNKVEQARKARIEAHVQSKVDAKIIKSELKDRWVNSILACESNQEMLDAMEAPAVTASATTPKTPRGAAPPPAETVKDGQDPEAELAELVTELNKPIGKDPSPEAMKRRTAMAKRARELRGMGDISFAATEYKIIDGRLVQVVS